MDPLTAEKFRMEAMALGAIFLAPNLLTIHEVKPEWFSNPAYECVVKAILGFGDAPKWDGAMLAAKLTEHGAAKAVGGHGGMATLMHEGGIPANFAHYAAELEAAHMARRLRAECLAAIASLEEGDDAATVQSAMLANLASMPGDKRTVRIGDVAAGCAARMIEESEAGVVGVTTGLPTLDRITGGLKPGQFIVVGARPGVGKTSVLGNMAMASAASGVPTLFMTLEMGADEIVCRMLSGLARVQPRARITEFGQRALADAVNAVSGLPLFLREAKETIGAVLAAVRQEVARHRIGLVCIDYLQLVSADKKSDSRASDVQEITRRLKTTARALGVPFLVACQLNRDAHGEQPSLKHLRESGAIEQDTDIVILLWEHPPDAAEYVPIIPVDLIVAKHRGGRTGTIATTFNRDICVFMERVRQGEEA